MRRLAGFWGVDRLGVSLSCGVLLFALVPNGLSNPNVYVSRFWHNHQPIYWPEWNSNGNQTNRVQYAWDSIVVKPGQNYGGLSPAQHPENNLTEIFGIGDRVSSYQSGPRNSLAGFNSAGGFAISYSGSLIDNIRQLGSVGQLGYGAGWNAGYREARGWKTPAGSTRMDLVGFTYHHSLAPLLPKSVLRKEIQTFKQAWWKAWGGKSDLSDHSKGFFPTEMGYSRHIVDALVDEGYQWVIVPSHHISRTCPTYNNQANPTGSYNIFSSPPNKADQLGPSPTTGWWYGEPNPGNAAWNVAPFAYQLHKVKYVNPESGAEKTMIAVPSDDVLSYRFGYAAEGIGKIKDSISPHATDPSRPVIVMPSTDGDNAWGGGASSWFEATPQFFNSSASDGYKPSTPQDFVNAFGANAPVTHIEDGAWIFPEMCYGSPNFMKWIEPPVATVANRGLTTVPGTQIDMETPGFALKFYSYAPLMAGANWCETAEQILKDEGGSVQAWKVATPYDWDGSWTSPNEVEQAWHIYLVGLDSGFNYYGGLGNDDEMKPGLATRRAVGKLEAWMTPARRNNDRTGPTVLKPQRFPYNPGWYTFGWFNQQPQIPNNAFLKRMNSEFYIWTHAYDLNGVSKLEVKVRFDIDGTNSMASNQNETYAGGSEVGAWQTLPMTKRELPKTREALNAAAANSQINYFLPVQTNAVADYYFTRIAETNLPGFRNKLIDYYIEATDTKGNVSKSEIQHVWVDDFSGASNSGGGGGGSTSNNVVTLNPTTPVSGQPLTVTYNPAGRGLASATSVNIHHGFNQNIPANWTPLPGVAMTKSGSNWVVTYTVASNATTIAMVFNTGGNSWDNNGGGNWNFNVTNAPLTNAPPVPTGLSAAGTSTNTVSLNWNAAPTASGYLIYRNGSILASNQFVNFLDTTCTPDTEYTYAVAATNSVGSSGPSLGVTATTFFLPVSNNALRLVNPTNGAAVSSNSFAFRGHAGLGLTNGLRWSNSLNGQTGAISFTGLTNASGWAWTASLPLGNGSNNFIFTSTYPTNGPVLQTGSDSPTNYNGWASGSSNGTGFGPWTITTTGTSAGSFLADTSLTQTVGTDSATNYGASWTNGSGGGSGFANWSFDTNSTGTFTFGNPTNAGISGMGTKAFLLRTPGGNTYATANRALSQTLSVGQTLSFLWGINWDCDTTNGAKGFVVFSGTNEIVVVNNANSSNITCNSVNTGFGYGTTAMRWSFRFNSNNILQVSANARNGGGTFNTNLTVAGAPSSVRFYAANMETNVNREPFFDDFRIEGPANGNMNVGSSKGFGLWANTTSSVTARRALPASFDSGDSLTVRIDNNRIDSGNRVGLALATAGGTNRLNFFFIGGQTTYRIDDAVANRDSGLAYTADGLQLTFTMTSSNAYTLSTGASVLTGTLGAGGPITQLVVYNNNAGTGTDFNFYVGEMVFAEQQTTTAVVALSAPTIILPSVTSGIPNSWWDAYGISSGDRTVTADPDGDGWTNAQEFAFGLSPNVPDGKSADIDPSNPAKIQFLQRNSGVTYEVQATSDVGAGFSEIVNAMPAANQSDVPTGYRRYEAAFPPGTRSFLRVKATLSP